MSLEGPGSTIGRYKLLQELGEGGFGVVYLAEQHEPVRRRVALKIIKLGMDTKQVIARFEAERQALALMDHQNIANVLDAGATKNGRPYFVMELVKGIPITEFCDQAQLDTAARLDLFCQVCHAIQHAHGKGIIHRDIKPSNVLVALHDGVAVPKVIDFGIAKATDRPLTEKTLFTEFRQMIGTPEYMAPEQAEMSGLDVDTRADVYSLGVLLYELMTGTKPFDMKDLLQSGYEEMLRTIREVDPPKPSTRVSTMTGQVTVKGRESARVLGQQLRGELDWIVMKALAKDRSRRYDTVNGLAMDIRRHLDHRPVEAGPPSKLYRIRKYVRRHRLGVSATTTVAAALLGGAVIAFASYADAAQTRNLARTARDHASQDAVAAAHAATSEAEQRELAEAQEAQAKTDAGKANTVLDLMDEMLRAADPRTVHKDYTVREMLDDFDRELDTQLEDEPEVEATIRLTMGKAYVNLGIYDKAEPHLKAAIETRRKVLGEQSAEFAEALVARINLLNERDLYVEAEKLARQALAIRQSLFGDGPATAEVLNQLAFCSGGLGRYDEAERLARRARAMHRATNGAGVHILGWVLYQTAQYDEAEKLLRETVETLGVDHPSVIGAINILGLVLVAKADYDGAEKLLREALRRSLQVFGDKHPRTANAMQHLAHCLREKGDPSGARELYEKALVIVRKSFGEDHLQVAMLLGAMATMLRQYDSYDEAEALTREAIKVSRRAVGGDHPIVGRWLADLASVRSAKADYDGAEQLARQALAILRKSFGDEHPQVVAALHGIGEALLGRGDLDGAEEFYRRALDIKRRVFGDNHPDVAVQLAYVAGVLEQKADYDGAAKLHRQAIAIKRRLLGNRNVRLVPDLHALAGVRLARGDYAGCRKLREEALEITRATLGDRHPWVARLQTGLARVLHEQGHLQQAEKLGQEALAVLRANPDLRLLSLPWAQQVLAAVISARGDYQRAAELGQQAVAAYREALGEDHPSTLAARGDYAIGLRRRGRFDESIRILRDVLARTRRSRGDEHPNTARSLGALAVSLRSAGQLAEAERLHRESLTIRRKVFGDHHPSVAESWGGLGNVLVDLGKLDEARECQENALAIQRRVHGGDQHTAVAIALNNLAQTLPDPTEAKALIRKSLAILSRTVGNEHPMRVALRHNLAGKLADQGQLDEAEKLYLEVLALRRKLLGVHPDVANTLLCLARNSAHRGDLDTAENYYQQAVTVHRKVFRDGHWLLARNLYELGHTQFQRKKREDAARSILEAAEICRERLSEGHPWVLAFSPTLGRALKTLGHTDEAERIDRAALAEYQKRGTTRRVPVADLIHDLAHFAEARSEYQEAERLHRQALELRRELKADPMRELGCLAWALSRKGDHTQAVILQREALALSRKSHGDGHKTTIAYCARLTEILVRKGDLAQAETIARKQLAANRSAAMLVSLGMGLLAGKRPAEAETVLREALAMRTTEDPKGWLRYSAMDLLGEALLDQKNYAEAEPLLVEAYEKMEPPTSRAFRKPAARARLARLYEEWGQPKKAAEYRAE